MADPVASKPKRKYRRRAKAEPVGAYAVIVTVRHGRKSETIYGESVRTENGCLVVMSMDGPPPLIEKTRYIPLGSAEIEVCQRMKPATETVWTKPQMSWTAPPQGSVPIGVSGYGVTTNTAGPRIEPGPLEILRQREAQGRVPMPRPTQSQIVERNPDGIAVVTAGFLDGSPT